VSLGLRLNLLFASVLTLLLIAAGVLIVDRARDSVADEMDSAVRLTLQLLAAASGGLAETGQTAERDGLADGAAATAGTAAGLLARLARLRNVRHVDLALVPADGRLPFAPRDPSTATAPGAPAWFSRAVAPEPIEYRQRYGPPGRVVEIALRPNPADEIAEAWEESVSTFALLVAFAALAMILTSFTLHHAFKPIARIVTALGRLEQGDFAAARLRDFSLLELRPISTRFNRMIDAMALQREENRTLRGQALAIQEAERGHLARELHDELGQSISAIKALAVATRRNARALESSRRNAGTIAEVCDHVYDVVRRLMSELRPPMLDTLGLGASLEKLVEDWRRRHGDIDTRLTVDAALPTLPEDMAIKAYRIVQECLTNVARHAAATRIEIDVSTEPATGRLLLRIADNGNGFDPTAHRLGLGLLGIRERIASLDGSIDIASHPGAGTCVTVVLPLPADDEQATAPPVAPADLETV
jgi:two-component system sensor histidine kinase UhpB